MDKELLLKFLSSEYSEKELETIKRWFRNEASTEYGKSIIFNDWNTFIEEEYDVDYERLLDIIHSRIQSGRKADKRIIIIRTFSRIAAILFIPLLLMFFYTTYHNEFGRYRETVDRVDSLEIIASPGSQAEFCFDDGTKVYLNYDSKIKYPRRFSNNARNISLTGEAYFEVASNPQKPFIVSSKGMYVKVLGTKFNINAYHENKYITTTLLEGKVEVNNFDDTKVAELLPGQGFHYNPSTGGYLKFDGDMTGYAAWKDGLLIFDNTPLDEVAIRLERMFNVDIKFDSQIELHSYTARFRDEPLYRILDLMTIAMPIRYQIEKRKLLPDGTYSKQKILIYKK